MRTLSLWMTMLGLILGGAALEGAHLHALIQPTAAIIVFGPVVAFLLFRLGIKQSAALTLRVLRDEAGAPDLIILDRIVTLGYLGAALAALMGIIHCMQNLAEPSRLGAGLAVAFVGVFYGTLPSLLLATVGTTPRLERGESRKAERFLAASVLFLLFSFATVLYALTRSNSANYLS